MKLLVFTPHGGVELLASEAPDAKQLWSSDDDDDFLQLFDDVVKPDDEEQFEVLEDYLVDRGYLKDDEEYASEEQYLDDTEESDADD